MENEQAGKTVIGENLTIKGTINSDEAVHIDGILEGDLICQSDATIGSTAHINGNINVQSIIIEGSVDGNITADDKIALCSTARVHGDIKAKRLSVEDGVTLVGHLEVNPVQKQQGKPQKKAAPTMSHETRTIKPNQSAAVKNDNIDDQDDEEKKRIFITL